MFKNTTPLLFIIFNRPESTKIVFEEIRKSQPPRIYIASDGPRIDRPREKEIVESLRISILEAIDWNCEVKTLYRDTNLGCKNAVKGAIDWFFKNEESGIILEDDCVPSQSFFRFCQNILTEYKDDNRVSGVSGTNFNYRISNEGNGSFFFSEILYMWGWGTWRRCWEEADEFYENFNFHKQKKAFSNVIPNKIANKMWIKESYRAINGELDTWDYQWLFFNITQNKLAIIPTVNLVQNIGFSLEATHTRHVRKELVVDAKEIAFPLQKPPFMVRNLHYDIYFYELIYGWVSLPKRFFNKFRKIFSFS